MKKVFLILFALALPMLAFSGAHAQVHPLLGQPMLDFTMTTCEGDEVSLSALLEEKDLVIVNIFTTWCNPCREEFPIIQEVYEEYSDRIEIVSVSNEPNDTDAVIADYKARLGLTFPMGSGTGTGIVKFANINYYPTTLFIDKSGKVVLYSDQVIVFESQLRAPIEHFLAADYDGQPAVAFNYFVCDEDGHPVPGTRVSLCSDDVCIPLVSDDEGVIAFVGKPDDYHLQILSLPEGCSIEENAEPEPIGDAWSLIVVEREPGCICD